MPWSNQSGGGGWQGGGNRGPWSQGPSGGGSQTPDLEELLKRGQDRFRRAMPGGFGSGGIAIVVVALLVIWFSTGFYTVREGERGVEVQFGAFSKVTNEGLNYHWPYPIQSVRKVSVTLQRKEDIGFREAAGSRGGITGEVPQESLMLTGDENIVDVNFSVIWDISDARGYVFNVRDPDPTVKAVAESAMREVVGRSRIDLIQTEDRTVTQEAVRTLIQQTLDSYGAGIRIREIQMQRVGPPEQVVEAFQDVQAAKADQQRFINEATAYRNKVVPGARGDAERIRQEAEAYREQTVAQARGEAQRFLAVYNEYKVAKEVTRRRLYLETMERILGRTDKIIIEDKAGSGVVPYLPLDQLSKSQAARRSPEGTTP